MLSSAKSIICRIFKNYCVLFLINYKGLKQYEELALTETVSVQQGIRAGHVTKVSLHGDLVVTLGPVK